MNNAVSLRPKAQNGYPVPALILAHLAHCVKVHVPDYEQRGALVGHISDLLSDEDGAALREMAE